MKIAIDCAGTLLDRDHQPKLLNFIEQAVDKGHQVVIWSSSSSYLVDAVKLLNVAQVKGREKITTQMKLWKYDVREEPESLFDIAIDDSLEHGELLATKKAVHPNDIGDVSL